MKIWLDRWMFLWLSARALQITIVQQHSDLIKYRIKDEDPSHPIVKETYKEYVRKNDKILECRKDAALIAQLRSGYCLSLSHYRNRIDQTKSPTCPACKEEEETVKHWLNCPATVMTRENVFGRSNVSLDTLNKDPAKTLAFAEATLLKRKEPSDAIVA